MAGRGQQQQQQEPAGEEVKWPEARDKEPGNGFQTIELGDASARPDGAEAAATSMLRRLSSRKARRLEWNVQEYTVRLRRKRTLTILQNIGKSLSMGLKQWGWFNRAVTQQTDSPPHPNPSRTRRGRNIDLHHWAKWMRQDEPLGAYLCGFWPNHQLHVCYTLDQLTSTTTTNRTASPSGTSPLRARCGWTGRR